MGPDLYPWQSVNETIIFLQDIRETGCCLLVAVAVAVAVSVAVVLVVLVVVIVVVVTINVWRSTRSEEMLCEGEDGEGMERWMMSREEYQRDERGW